MEKRQHRSREKCRSEGLWPLSEVENKEGMVADITMTLPKSSRMGLAACINQ
jgi:hypothetical protein